MDFILNAIEKKIKRFEGKAESKVYYQVKVEYSFYLILSYLWNCNFEEIGIADFVLQSNIVREIQRPSIGTIASLIKKLDINKELERETGRTGKSELTSYAEVRNDLIGHGYSFEDGLSEYSEAFEEWFEILQQLRVQVLSRNTDLVICQGFDEKTGDYFGTIYDYTGDIRSNWRCSGEVCDFEIENLYACYESNTYFRLSPFIYIDTEDDGLYVYRNVEQPLLGKIRYNRIDRSLKNFSKCWREFEFIANNGLLRKQSNGCVVNVFNANYKRYIDVGSIKEKIYDFLIGKEKGSSVCVTLWGHGGNGKTATVQKICEELALNERGQFEFIIFLSAKDRELNKHTGKIVSISRENRVATFEELIKKLNLLLYSESSISTVRIVNDTSRLLLVIDDYETFEDEDKEKITAFIKQLNTNCHKVIITTRNSFLKIGDDIQTNELDVSHTIKFLLEVLVNEHNYTVLQLKDVEAEIKRGDTKKEIHRLTLGKPIEIIRFVNCFIQKGKLSDDFLKEMRKVNSRSERNEFLYGRNYVQLKGDKLAQDIFVVIGLLTPQESLTSLLKHIKLILNRKEEDDAVFISAIDKLVKLRLIEVDEDDSYKVDSKDILEIMKQEYDKRDHGFKSGTKAIYDRIKSNITFDTDRALLNHAKSLRHQSNSETTIQQYREILKQGKDFSYSVKLESLLDLTDFVFNFRGDKEAAIKIFDEYFDKFYEFEVLKRYASYVWSVDKEKAIRILEDFNSKYASRILSLSKRQKLHLLGLVVMRECFYWNDRYDNEIHNRGKIKKEFQRVFNNYGHLLVANLKSFFTNTSELNSEELNDITLALEGLIDICYRLHNNQYAIDVCRYALIAFPERTYARFKRRLDKINGYRSYIKPSKPQNDSRDANRASSLNEIDIINLEVKDAGYVGEILKIYRDNRVYGYIGVKSSEISGRVYFRESSIVTSLEELRVGDKVEFGFGKITPYKFGAIDVKKVKSKRLGELA
jgi:hypothetical protein